MRGADFLRIITNLNRHQFGRNVMRVMVRRATERALNDEVQDADPFSRFYERVWKPTGQVPDDVVDQLCRALGTCDECGQEPILDRDEYRGVYSRNHYCSAKCQRDAHDDEDSRKCEGCGDWFDTNNGFYFEGQDYCSEDCAWEALTYCYELREFCKKHPGIEESVLLDKVKELEWYRVDGSQELRDLFREAASKIMHCGVCEEYVDPEESRQIADLDEEWFCSDHHVWEGIAQYLDVLTNRNWSAYQAQQLLKDHVLWELEGPGKLDAALKQKGIS